MSRVSLPREAPLQRSPAISLDIEWRWSLIRAHWGAITILLAFTIANLVVSPFFESPMVDDWSYAFTVKRLVEDHQFSQLGWTAVTLVSQTLWGTLFSLPFGFSFGALHLSTAILSLAGLLAFYELGRELGLGEGKSVLLALTLFVNPVYLGLSYTFMTDVPSTALSTVALWLYVIAIRKSSPRWWLFGSIACAIALLSRQTAGIVGLGAAAWLFKQQSRAPDAWKNIAAAIGAPLLAALGFGLWLNYVNTIPEGYSYNAAQLAKLLPEVATRNVLLLIPVNLFYLGLFALPYLAGLLSDVRRFLTSTTLAWALLGILTMAALAFLLFRWFGWPMPFLRYGAVLSQSGTGPNDLLGARPAILGPFEQWALTVLAGTGAATLITIGVCRLRTSWLFGPSPVGLLGFVAAAQVVWLLFGYLYLWEWVLFDRYFLPVLPPVLLLLAAATRKARLRWLLATPILALFGLFSLLGIHDWIAYRQTAWSAAQTLVDQGVPLRSIDAGLEWDGWQLYEFSQSHPEEWHHADASPFWIGRRVAPVITSEYVISFSPLDDYSTVSTITYASWLALREEHLYILHKQGP